MADDLGIPFHRVTYRDGQLLAAQDLRDDHRHALRRHALHTRYLHETWGIALGFELTVEDDKRTLAIGPGHAIDALGRDILLARGGKVAVPHVADHPERFVLTLRHREDAAFRDRRELDLVCLSSGLDLRNERPVFSWYRPGEVRFGIEVPLASVVVDDGLICHGPDLRVRRTTRPLVRPHIGSGETEAGRTGWQYNIEDTASPDFGLFVTVDTSAAGFTHAPLYFAQVIGDFSAPPRGRNLAEFGPHAALSLGSQVYIAQSSQAGFTLRITPHTAVDAEEAERRRWQVAWIGMEPMAGCVPGMVWLQLFFLAHFYNQPPGR